LSKPTLVQGGVKVWHGASRLEVGGALRLRLEAPAFAKTTARQGGKRTDDRGQEELGTRASRHMPAASLGHYAALSLVVRGRGRL